MEVVGVDVYGGPEALKLFELPDPHAGPGEVRIRVYGAAVSPTDTFVRNGDRRAGQSRFPPPYVPGMDAAGILDEIGPGTTTALAVGDRVMAIVVPRASHGAYSQYLVLPAESVAAAPAGADHGEASTLPMNGLTARMTLDLLALSPGQTLAVTGAAGAYGGYMVQLAKAQGLRVIADASPADEALVRSLGADDVVPRGPDVAAAIRGVVAGGVDALADGSVQQSAVMPAIRDGGQFAAVRMYEGETERGITIHQVLVSKYFKEQAKLDGLRQLVEDGKVALRVAQRIPAAQASEAHRLLEAGGARGRFVIEF